MLPAFANSQLLRTALTHRSALNELKALPAQSNERLEFLGDAVLELLVSEYLYAHFPEEQEGILTVYRSALVKTTTLAEVATKLKLGEQLLMSKGEEAGGGRSNASILADTVEAVIGAIFLDQGSVAAQAFIAEHILSKLPDIRSQKLYKDAKSELQEVVQGMKIAAPVYVVESAEGPDHDKQFTISVMINGENLGVGQGKSKQLAQQQAAAQALEKLQAQP